MSATDRTKAFLAEHPRMIGILFTVLMLLSQASTVAAGDNAVRIGP